MNKFISFLILFSLVSCQNDKFETKSDVSETLSNENDISGYKRAEKPIKFEFPKDHGKHDDFKTEWWYFTGNLNSINDLDKKYGFQLTFFRSSLSPNKLERKSKWATNQIYLGHFTLSDIYNNKFYYSQKYSRESSGLSGVNINPFFELWIEDWYINNKDNKYNLIAENDNFKINLSLEETKPIVLNGNKGLSQKSIKKGNASYYYSHTRLKTKGQISINDEIIEVEGLSWFDREWSTSVLEKSQKGWDWFSLQLEDGREFMLYQLREKDNKADNNSSGTFIYKDGTYRNLKKGDFSIEVIDHWFSNKTNIKYPSKWNLKIPSENINAIVTPYINNQELLLDFTYWEGAVKIESNNLKGNGYVELTGYK